MATHSLSFAPQVTTDAEFRIFGKFISDIFGLSFSQIYSNINWTTITRAGISTVAGKEIWSSNDAGGGLNNFYVLVEYGQGANANYMCIWLTVGWSHDGAGNLTGVTTTRQECRQGAQSATPITNYGSADAGRCRGVINSSISSVAVCFSIERLKENGAFVNKVNCAVNSNSIGQLNQTSKTGYAYTAINGGGLLNPAFATSANINEGYVGLGFAFPFANGWGNKLRNWMSVPSGQLGAVGGTVPVEIGGVSSDYLITHPIGGAGLIGSSTNYNGLMLYQ